jgi:hypothetical protein
MGRWDRGRRLAIYKGSVEGGLLCLPPSAKRKLSQMEGKPCEVQINPWSDNRSSRQNRYYWSCVIPGAVAAFRFDWGVQFTPQAAHDACRTQFLGVQRFGVKQVAVVRSSATLTSAEFSAYIDTIRHWALHDCGVVIPTPEELGWGF